MAQKIHSVKFYQAYYEDTLESLINDVLMKNPSWKFVGVATLRQGKHTQMLFEEEVEFNGRG